MNISDKTTGSGVDRMQKISRPEPSYLKLAPNKRDHDP